MKIKHLLTAAMAVALVGCGQAPTLEVMTFTNNLTPEEIEAAKFTPEVMWKMGRVGSQKLSPDGKLVAFTITYYNIITYIYISILNPISRYIKVRCIKYSRSKCLNSIIS